MCYAVCLLVQAISVPETLLKKRKQNEKAREERLAAATEARKVSDHDALNPLPPFIYDA